MTAQTTQQAETRPMVAGYLRVSTERQAVDGLGLDVQRGAVEAFARQEGYEVEWYSDEGVSGALDAEQRDGLASALAAIRDGDVCGLVVYSLDRVARALTVQEAVLALAWDAGGRVWSVGDGGEVLQDDPDDPMRTAIRQMRGVFAQLDRALIVKRLRDGRRVKGERGEFAYGSPAYGFRALNGALVPDETEQAAVARMTELRAAGASLRGIAEALTAEGHRPKRSETWHAQSIRRALARVAEGTQNVCQ